MDKLNKRITVEQARYMSEIATLIHEIQALSDYDCSYCYAGHVHWFEVEVRATGGNSDHSLNFGYMQLEKDYYKKAEFEKAVFTLNAILKDLKSQAKITIKPRLKNET